MPPSEMREVQGLIRGLSSGLQEPGADHTMRAIHLRRSSVVKETLLGAINTQLLQPGDEVVSLYHRRIEHGYPTPSLGRDAVLAKALPYLQQYNIWSRGRFGSYKVRRIGTWLDGDDILHPPSPQLDLMSVRGHALNGMLIFIPPGFSMCSTRSRTKITA